MNNYYDGNLRLFRGSYRYCDSNGQERSANITVDYDQEFTITVPNEVKEN